MRRSVAVVLTLAALLPALVGGAEARGISTTAAKAQEFLGSRPARVVYTYSGAVYYIDFSESSLRERTIFSGTPDDQSLQISPDGTRICYSIGGKTFVRTVMENSPSSDVRSIGSGLLPHWWRKPSTGDEYLLLQRDGIYCQKLDAQSRPEGSATKLIGDKLANGGRTGDGAYLASEGAGSDDAFMWKISPAEATSGAKVEGMVEFGGYGNDSAYCNASASPAVSTSSRYFACLLHLGRYHTQVYIRRFSTDGAMVGGRLLVKGSRIAEFPSSLMGELEFVSPEWSTHERFFSTGGIPIDDKALKERANGYIVDMDARKALRFMDSGLKFSHLWVSGSSATAVRARISASPATGAAPLTVRFDASGSSGSNLTCAWEFGDGSTGTGVSVTHTYLAAGIYTATLTVRSGTASDKVQTTVSAGEQAAVVTTVELTPAGPLSLTAGQMVTFGATVRDQFGQAIDDPGSIVWSVEGAAGGTITPQGVYSAGTVAGRTGLVAATVGNVRGECSVAIVGEAIVLTSDPAGRTFSAGDVVDIRWVADQTRVTQIVVSLSPDGGRNWYQISQGNAITPGSPQWGNSPWTVAETVLAADGTPVSVVSSQCQVLVGAYDDAGGVVPARSGAFTIRSAPTGEQTVIRTFPFKVNVGGTAAMGYVADGPWSQSAGYGYLDGTKASESVVGAGEVGGTDEDDVLRAMRAGDFSYRIAVPNGAYVVSLLFADWWREPGQRTFTATVEGVTAGTGTIDVVGSVGTAFALAVTQAVNVGDGAIDVALAPGNGTPLLSAIVVALPGASTATSVMSGPAGRYLKAIPGGIAFSPARRGDEVRVFAVSGRQVLRVALHDGQTRVGLAGAASLSPAVACYFAGAGESGAPQMITVSRAAGSATGTGRE